MSTIVADFGLDILHSYLGLATLSSLGVPDIRSIDPILCLTLRAKDEFEARQSSP